MFKETGALGSTIGSANAQLAQPPREGEIVEGLRALGVAIDSMEGAAMGLTQRIAPVLRPPVPTTDASGIGSEQCTPFGLELARLQTRVWNITHMISETSGRLELP